MKTLWNLAVVMLLALFAVQPVVFSETAVSGSLVEVGNKICPVSGEPVGAMGEPCRVEYEGKLYNLCCKMCAKDFKEDPKKYSRIAEASDKVETKGEGMMHHGEEASHGEHGEHGMHGGGSGHGAGH